MFRIYTLLIISFFFFSGNTNAQYQSTTVSKKKVLQHYLKAVTQTSNYRKAVKKTMEIETLKKDFTISPNKGTIKMKGTSYFKFPNKNTSRMEFNGLLIQASIFNGDEGIIKKMNQQQELEVDTLSEKEVHIKRKTAAVFPEFSLLCNLENVKMLGIESKKGIDDAYVLQFSLDSTVITARYNVKTGLKEYAEVNEVKNGKKLSYSIIYSNYSDYSGYLFPTTTNQLIESMSVKTTINSIEINHQIDEKVFAFH